MPRTIRLISRPVRPSRVVGTAAGLVLASALAPVLALALALVLALALALVSGWAERALPAACASG